MEKSGSIVKAIYKATGRPIDAPFAHVWHLQNGRIVRFQQYMNTKQWADTLGD